MSKRRRSLLFSCSLAMCTESGTRTHTTITGQKILSLSCLPFHHFCNNRRYPLITCCKGNKISVNMQTHFPPPPSNTSKITYPKPPSITPTNTSFAKPQPYATISFTKGQLTPAVILFSQICEDKEKLLTLYWEGISVACSQFGLMTNIELSSL